MNPAVPPCAAISPGPRRPAGGRRIPAAALLALACAFAAAAPRPARCAAVDAVPPDAVLVAFLNVKEDDPGQKWIFNEITRYLLAEAQDKEEAPPVSDVTIFRFSDFCYALLPLAKDGRPQMLMAADLLSSKGSFGLTYGGSRIQLNVRNKGEATTTQTSLLTLLLGIACRVPPESASENGIYESPPGEKRRYFTSFFVSDEKALVASGKGIIKEGLAGKNRLADTRGYREALSLLPSGGDAYGYAQNENGALESALGPRGKGWKNLLVALLSPAKRVGLALDVVDRDTSRATAVLMTDTPAGVKPLRERIEPTLAALVAQFLDPRLKCALRYEELPKALRINAEMTNTAPFWRAVFHRRVRKPKPAPGTPPAPPRDLQHR